MSTKLLVDVSYLIYNSFFKSKRQYFSKNSINTEENYDWNCNEKFKRILEKNIKNNIYRLQNNFQIKYKDIIFVRDCLRETIWRTKIYPKYKANRSSILKHDNINQYLGNLFIYLYNEYLPMLLKKFGISMIKVEEAEADDIIFVFAKLLEKNNISSIIIANDTDFYQILSDKIKMYDLSLKEEKKINNPDQHLLYKILRGDKSDNIHGFRIKKKEFFENKILSDTISNNIPLFLNNRKLIDYKCIPLYIKDRIYQLFNKEITL